MKTKPTYFRVGCISLLSYLAPLSPLVSAPAAQTGFERDDTQIWELYVPVESDSAGCAFNVVSVSDVRTHRGTACAGLSAKTPARLGLEPKANPILVAPGEKYRFSAWVKAGANWRAAPDSPGVVLQFLLRDTLQKEIASGPLFIGLKGASGDPAKLSGPAIPTQWIQIEGVVEIPAGASEMIPFVFVWKGAGQVYIDDILVEKASADTQLTQVLK